jgi:hypothetical protein
MNINGTNYFFVTGGVGPPSLPNVWGTGSLTLGAGSVLIPDTNDPIITLTSTFGMFGSINGTYNTGNVPSGQLFGAGTVTVTLRPSMFVPGQYVAERATYTFVQPTPEPATLILFGSGALGLIGAKLRRRH